MALLNVLDIGRSGLQAHQEAMQTTSNNISNVNTPGYSRQRVQLESRAHQTNFGYRLGAGGVELTKTLRIHDDFVQKQILDESRVLGNLSARASVLGRLEGVAFHGLQDVSERVNQFFNNFRELSLNPEIPSLRVAVRESAASLTQGVQKVASSLETMRNGLDSQIEHSVDEINQLAGRLAELNQSITNIPGTRGVPHELLDKRDQVARELSVKLGVQVQEDQNGMFSVYVDGVGMLVHGAESNALQMVRNPGDAETDPGKVEIFLKTPMGFQHATRALPEGELGGMIQVRDTSIQKTLTELDRIAFEFSHAVNETHRQGTTLEWNGNDKGLFFTDIEDREGAALKLDLSEEVKRTANAIRVSYEEDAPSDNRVALDIVDLQTSSIISPFDPVSSKEHTVNEAVNNLISGIGSEVNGAKQMLESQQGILSQLDNYQKSISGVSLEEEAVNMMQFQAAFNASAKTMQVADEMLETILSLKD